MTVPMMSWKALLELGRGQPDEEINKRTAAVQPGNCGFLVYTSGTTGEPKAVMLSHDNIYFACAAVWSQLKYQSIGIKAEQERILSYLPLSHVAGLMVDIASSIYAPAKTPCHVTVHFARPYDLKAGKIKDRLCAVQPTIFLGVPLVWEKMADRIRAIGASTKGAKKKIADWAKRKGKLYQEERLLGGGGKEPGMYCLANKLVFSKVMAKIGLSKLKYAFTGAAPIRVDTLEYFASLGLNINEIYGMSESTGAVTWSSEPAHQWGSVGYSLGGTEVKAFKVDPTDINKKVECQRAPNLDTTEEEFMGELCFRGRGIMMGYLANPDLGQEHVDELTKKTRETIDSDGWLHSGDKGMVSAAGMVKITGRYKEIIIGEGGENIAPVPIEDYCKKTCDGINEVMMIGDKRKYNVALVTLKAIEGTETLDAGAKRVNPNCTTISQAMADETWISAITAAINSANSNGKICPNNAFKIQKFTILPENFSEEAGFLTPTKKLKRKEVEKFYAQMIDDMYASKDTYVRFNPARAASPSEVVVK
eukprot:TRINITY_DN43308_c0_g1_i1.p1 TRINITY_DN43308_c0_g1~~TRINITY_DN43308_c0_g1_i1.p1  ORF type:complete len:546 (+),score=116.62 TRINITY_DN43308_c0_g1_i1:36-1640(+)